MQSVASAGDSSVCLSIYVLICPSDWMIDSKFTLIWGLHEKSEIKPENPPYLPQASQYWIFSADIYPWE